jgi:tRNA(fMet)-specific endonuclease VapC
MLGPPGVMVSSRRGLKKGVGPIPENDLWIAACALQYGFVLVSRDGHFEYVEGLEVEAW